MSEPISQSVPHKELRPRVSQTWYIYVGKRASANLRIALDQGVWGTKEANNFAGLKRNDQVTFVNRFTSRSQPSPRGFPRMDSEAFRRAVGSAELVIRAEITSDVYEDLKPIWPDGAFPTRFRFRILEEVRDVELNRFLSSDAVDAVRQSSISQGRPYLAGMSDSDMTSKKDSINVTQAPDKVLSDHVWMFQANPEKFDLVSALRESNIGDDGSWTVGKYQKEMHAGDKIIFWVAGKESGIYAFGELVEEPYERDTQPTREDLAERPYLQQLWRVKYQYTQILSKPILRSVLKEHPILRNLSVLKFAQATTFRVTAQQWNAIRELIEGSISISHPVGPTAKPIPITSYTIEEALSELFLSQAELDTILARLRRKQNLIIQGPPGVGKTFVSRRLAYLFMGFKDASRVEMVQFHQSYSYEDFIQGYRPNRLGNFSIKQGIFYEFCLQAQRDSDRPYFFIIDEINRGNLSKIFGELMQLVEQDKRGKDFEIPLTYSETQQDRFYIPQNLYLIGMMNTADRSLSMVDYALRRRFAFATLEPKFMSEGFGNLLAGAGASPALIQKIRARFESLNKDIADDQRNLGPGYRIGHSYFCPGPQHPQLDEAWYQEVIEAEIKPLLEEYWLDDASKAGDYVSLLLA